MKLTWMLNNLIYTIKAYFGILNRCDDEPLDEYETKPCTPSLLPDYDYEPIIGNDRHPLL